MKRLGKCPRCGSTTQFFRMQCESFGCGSVRYKSGQFDNTMGCLERQTMNLTAKVGLLEKRNKHLEHLIEKTEDPEIRRALKALGNLIETSDAVEAADETPF